MPTFLYGDELTALYKIAYLHSNRVQVEMRIDGIRAVVMQYAYNIGQRHVPQSVRTTLEIFRCHVEYGATAGSKDIRADRHRNIDGVSGVRRRMCDRVRKCLAHGVIARDRKRDAVWFGWCVLCRRVAHQEFVTVLDERLDRIVQHAEANEQRFAARRYNPTQMIVRVWKLKTLDGYEVE